MYSFNLDGVVGQELAVIGVEALIMKFTLVNRAFAVYVM
jgi:hypothetical protein